jgi:phosphoribosylamine--glycine ligase
VRALVVGSGGREHALAWRLTLEGVDVVVAPGNGGTPANVAIQPTDTLGLADFAQRERIDLTVVGPEASLAAGLVDAFAARGLPVFGPTRAAARLEWSKTWAKDFFRRHRIPTAGSEVVDSEAGARRVVEQMGLPVVLKADGLASGKGVFVALTPADLDGAIDQLFYGQALRSAAGQVLVEECLEGPELSVMAFTDGERFSIMPPARDYKRLLDGDRGPNTGGMGGYSRPSYATPGLIDQVEQLVFKPALAGMLAEGTPYRGVLYAGLMLTRDGPRVLEFNCRFGDPECQLVLPLLGGSLGEVCAALASQRALPEQIAWSDGRTYGVALAAPGYPAAPVTGEPIGGLDELPADVLAFHAGTRRAQDSRLVTDGGRVLTVVGSDRKMVYQAAETIRFAGKQFRGDIGLESPSELGQVAAGMAVAR